MQPVEPLTEYTQFSTRYDSETGTIWCWMHPAPRPCMNVRLIDELMLLQQQLTGAYQHQPAERLWPFRHLVLASKTRGVYNLGGDLELMKHFIETRQADRLRDYAYKATDLVYNNIHNLDLPITMVSLVQGQALGAGFEAALSCDVIIAERQAELGFPEILFNMFPGMGAYNLLSRRTGIALAERIMLSGKTYSAEALYEMGIIDLLVDEGEGVEAVARYLKSHIQSHNTMCSMKKIRQIVQPITREALYAIVDIWLEASMNLDKKDLARMDRLLYLQRYSKDSSMLREQDATIIKRRSDWRKIKQVSFPLRTHLGETVFIDRRKLQDRRQRNQEEFA